MGSNRGADRGRASAIDPGEIREVDSACASEAHPAAHRGRYRECFGATHPGADCGDDQGVPAEAGALHRRDV